MSSPVESIRLNAMASIFPFIACKPQALEDAMPGYLEALFKLASDASPSVRKEVCRALVGVFENLATHLERHIDGVVNFMLHSSTDSSPEVAIEAVDFWLALCDTPHAYPILSQDNRLEKLVPILLRGMVFTDDDLALVGADADDSVADSLHDIKPKFSKSTLKGSAKGPSSGPGVMVDASGSLVEGFAGAGPGASAREHGLDGDDDDDEDDDDDDEDNNEWNLRKSSASALDSLSVTFSEDLLPPLLMNLNQMAASADWRHRECFVLAIGAVAEGCELGMAAYLPQLYPHLLSCLNEPKPIVRSIACWTLSRYARWVVEQATPATAGGPATAEARAAAEAAVKTYLEPTIRGLLVQMSGTNKRVQEAACSAISVLEEAARSLLDPYLHPIVSTFSLCFSRYQTHNLIALFDAAGTLAESVGSSLATPELANLLLPPILHKWQSYSFTDPAVSSLLDCLTSVVGAMGKAFLTLAEPTWTRAVLYVTQTVEADVRAQQGAGPEANKDIIVFSLDLISALCETLAGDIEALVPRSNIVPLLLHLSSEPTADVRQSVFALAGELFKAAFAHTRPYLEALIPAILKNINTSAVSAGNNACWALGECALRLGPEYAPFIIPTLQVAVPLLRPGTVKALRENATILIGRVCGACPADTAAQAQHFFEPWCSALTSVRDENSEEKESAYRGLIAIVHANPQGVSRSINFLLSAILAWKVAPRAVEASFKEIVLGFKSAMGDQWGSYRSHLTDNMKKNLDLRFKV